MTSRFSAIVFLGVFLFLAGRIEASPIQERCQALLQTYYDQGDFQGSALVAIGDEVIYSGGIGLANREWQIPNDADTKFRIASVTKQFTSLLAFQLVEEGRLDLEAPITRYLPYFREDVGSQLTLELLLQHRSGLPEMPLTTENLSWAAGLVDTDVPAFIQEFCSGDLTFEPGTEFSYCNAEYNLVGAILEEVTGKSFETLLSERVLTPLGMNDTGMARFEAVMPRQATGYEKQEDGTYHRAALTEWHVAYAAAGMYSTANDLLRWTRAVMNHELLSEKWTTVMFTPRDDIGVVGNYTAYGSWVYGRALPPENELQPTLIERRGFISPFTMLVVMAPEEEISLILMSNTTPAEIHQLPYANGLPLELLVLAFEKLEG